MSKTYESLSDGDKKKIIHQMYHKENKSFQQIAETLGTYANKIRRDAKKLEIKIRDKSEAQKNAIKTGSHKHPTKGTHRAESTKQKIGLSIMSNWENMSNQELQTRKDNAKKQWDKLSQEQKENMIQSANRAVRESSKTGSKLEKFLLNRLLADGYKVDFHKEQVLSNTKLQIDIFIPSLNTAIEVDGPSHFLPVWGDDVLDRNIQYDNKKTGLILGRGSVLIRIKQTHDFSKSRASIIYESLTKILQDIEKEFPTIDNRNIEIGD